MLSILLDILILLPSFPVPPLPQAATNSRWLAPFPGVQRPQTIPYHAGSGVSYPRLIRRVEPAQAKAATNQPVTGFADFELIINEKGEVWQARVLSSPSLLVDAALDAVRQWRYAPTIINGLPVPVITTASLSIGPPVGSSRCGAEPPRREPLRTGGNIQEQKLLRKVEPVYPQGAIGNGVIIIQVTINEQGDVYEVRMLRGPSILEQAVLAAVCQWKYSPTYLNGAAVPVIATVTIEFNLYRRK
jgi:TonB family protein